MANHRIPQATRKQAVELYKSGMNAKDVAYKLEISYCQVYQSLIRANVKTREKTK